MSGRARAYYTYPVVKVEIGMDCMIVDWLRWMVVGTTEERGGGSPAHDHRRAASGEMLAAAVYWCG